MARILITGGPTRAYLDDVRYLTNGSSGRMAAALATAAVALGHDVVVVSGPVSVRYPDAARVLPVITTGEMLAACLEQLPQVDGVIAAAAPCDFEPVRRATGKIPRQTDLVVQLKPTTDVIATVARKARAHQWMVAFALEPDARLEHADAPPPLRALEKITVKRCDLIVVNGLPAVDAATTSVAVYDRGHACVGRRCGSKRAVAGWLVRLFDRLFMDRPADGHAARGHHAPPTGRHRDVGKRRREATT
jgi:phosphopantothenoylcysteine decarboxylase/phosphopantothenate--cysteine ligase